MAICRQDGRLRFTSALNTCDVLFIAVGTPQGKDGAADLAYVLKAAKDIGSTI